MSEEKETKPLYGGEFEKVVEVLMKEIGITHANDPKPVIATYGLGTCVALAGYSPEHKIGFVTHFTQGTELDGSFGHLLYWLLEQSGRKPINFDVRIIGGERGASESIINSLKSRLNIRKDVRMNLVEEDTIGSEINGGKSIAIDTRDGKVYYYKPLLNPQHRTIDEVDRLGMLLPGTAHLVYPDIYGGKNGK